MNLFMCNIVHTFMNRSILAWPPHMRQRQAIQKCCLFADVFIDIEHVSIWRWAQKFGVLAIP